MELDKGSCFDCPLSFNMNDGKSGGCYTHKGLQRMGLNAILKSLKKKNTLGLIKEFCENEFTVFMTKARKKEIQLVRFGSYGEPVLMPYNVVEQLAALSRRWTGYTHQWNEPKYWEYSLFFMASCHDEKQAKQAKDAFWRSFIAADEHNESAVNCPASKEAGEKTTCANCGLCNGTTGNSNKNIYILKH
jgi:hypothetical protein